jgi:hypothetical protein
MRYNGIFVATESEQTVTTADVLIELGVPANTMIEIIRMWCSPAMNDAGPTDDMQEINIYSNDALATGGAGLTETELQGTGDVSLVTALGGPTQGSTPTVLYPDGFHLQNGWLYLPVPEERIRVVGAAAAAVGFKLSQAPESASEILSYGIIWGEIG